MANNNASYYADNAMDYPNANLAHIHPIMEGEFEAFLDLFADPDINDAATVARPVAVNHAPPPPQYSHHEPQHYAQPPVPVSVPSFGGSTSSITRAHYNPPAKRARTMAPPTPTAAPKQTIKMPKSAQPEVSPTSVTAVFESIPAPPAAAATAVAKSSPRKRSWTAAKPAPVTSTPAPPLPPADTSNLSYQEQEDLRRERNRHHAKKSRQRKKNYMNQLEDAVNEMRKENERLFDLLGMDSRQAKVDMAAEEERKRAESTEKFIAGLKQPRNRVFDATTLAFLRELWK